MRLGVVEQVDADNPVEGDLRLERGTLVWVTDLERQVVQRLRARLQFFQGEWFLDTREGTPYFQTILQKGTSDGVVRAIFSQIIRRTAGISALDRLTINRDNRRRELVLDFVARLEDGRVFTSRDFGPFIVRF